MDMVEDLNKAAYQTNQVTKGMVQLDNMIDKMSGFTNTMATKMHSLKEMGRNLATISRSLAAKATVAAKNCDDYFSQYR